MTSSSPDTMHVVAPEGQTTITLSRWFAAPPEALWKAWTDPASLARWWGPFENPVCELDARRGGAYRIVMQSPDGIHFPLTGVFEDLQPPVRVVLTMSTKEHPSDWHKLFNTYRGAPKDSRADDLRLIATFAPSDGGTVLTVEARFTSVADRDAHLTMSTTKGWGTSFDRLQAVLSAR
ncbi:MAG: SRPBCC domain-containing protein [Bacteroidetes bacterium]|jgi:uncharacterized protein YndB with AHSA1/START domain|nr:SRPBCC domain-containing protein [Bacteroidota bacterium]